MDGKQAKEKKKKKTNLTSFQVFLALFFARQYYCLHRNSCWSNDNNKENRVKKMAKHCLSNM